MEEDDVSSISDDSEENKAFIIKNEINKDLKMNASMNSKSVNNQILN